MPFDPETYLSTIENEELPSPPPKPEPKPEPDAEEFKPRLTTFYYPQTPEETRAAGLSYRMEGGTQGGGKFGDIDLRQHTLEQYQAGKSPWVAVAMPGEPTGKIYNIPYGDGYIKGRNVDTGGGLRPGQVDIATSNPELARGYAKRDEYVSEFPRVSTEIPESRLPPITESDIDRLLGKDKKEEPKRTAKAKPAPSFTPRPIPRIDVNIPQMPMTQIGPPDLTAPGTFGGIGQPIPPPQIPQIPQFPMAQAQPLPMPTPAFGIGVQEAIEQVPQSALLAGQPTTAAVGAAFNPEEYLAQIEQEAPATPTPSPTPSPSITPVAAQQAQPTQTITPAPQAAAAFDPEAYLAEITSGQELPSPEIGAQEPGVVQKVGTALGRYATGFLPRSAQDVAAMSGVPTGFSPEQLAPLVMPQLKPTIDIARQGMTRAQQIRGLEEKQVPAGAQERYDVGIGTVLDVGGLAGLRFLGRGKGAGVPRARKVQPPPIQAEPPAQAGTVRLYHGSSARSPQAGRDFTTSRQYAEDYAAKAEGGGGGQLWYVDVPEGLLKTHDETGQPMSRVIVPDEIADLAQRVGKPPPPAEAAAPKRVQSVTDIPEEYLREAKDGTPVKENPVKSGSIWNIEKTLLDKVLGETPIGKIGTNMNLAKSRAHQIRAEADYALKQAGWNKLTNAEKAQLDMVRVIGEGNPLGLDIPADFKPTARVKKIADEIQNYLKTTDAEYNRLGATVEVNPIYRDKATGKTVQDSLRVPYQGLENYWPRKIDQNNVATVPDAPFMRDMQRVNPELSPTDIADVVAGMKAQARGLKDPTVVNPENLKLIKGDPFVPGHLHARTKLNYPEYIYKSLYDTIPDYIEMSSRERGFLEVFGPEADKIVESKISELGYTNKDVRLASETWDRYRGKFIEPESSLRIQQTMHILNNLASLLLLGVQTAFLQPSQIAFLGGRFGTANLLKGMGRLIADPKSGWGQAERAGSFLNSILEDNSLISRIGPEATKAKAGPRAGFLRRLEIATANLSSEAMKWSGVKFMDKLPRSIGYWTTRYALEDAKRGALRGNKKSQVILDEAGIDVAADAHETARGAGELSRKYNITSDNMPYWLQNTPYGAAARGLQSFNVGVSQRMWNSFIKPALPKKLGGRGDPVPLLRLLAYSQLVGEGIGDVRDWLTGKRSRPGGPLAEFLDDVIHGRATSKEITMRALDNLAWSGTMGYAQSIYGAFKYAMSGIEKGTRLASVVSGAGLSNASEMAMGAAELGVGGFQALFTDPNDEKSRKEYENHLRTGGRILARRIPVFGGVVAPRTFPGEAADRKVAVAGMKRARRAGNAERYRDWEDWFMRRHPDRRISEKALEKD